MKRLLPIVLILSVWTSMQGQGLTRDVDLQEYIESIFATQDLDVDYNDLYETFLQLTTNPINLNNTNKEDLRSLYILTDEQIDSLASYIASNGRLISKYEFAGRAWV